MSDAGSSDRTRPMQPADYRQGDPVPMAGDHPTRDLILGAIIGAAALWVVPRVLDHFAGDWLQNDSEELELEP